MENNNRLIPSRKKGKLKYKPGLKIKRRSLGKVEEYAQLKTLKPFLKSNGKIVYESDLDNCLYHLKINGVTSERTCRKLESVIGDGNGNIFLRTISGSYN